MFKSRNLNYSLGTIVFAVVLLISLAIRLYSITDRPFHNDEGVNYFFVIDVLTNGYYPYSHQNYHGPSFFYLLSFFCYYFGFSELSIRSASILPSIVLIFWVMFRSEFLSLRSRIVTSLMLAISTTFVYYSRYAIHETLLVLASYLSLHYFFSWNIRRSRIDLVFFFLSLALCIVTKETFIIHAFAFVVASVLTFPFRPMVKKLEDQFPAVLWGVLLSLGVIFIFYTGFFKSSEGIRELFYGVPQWIGRGHSDVGHYKPFDYYYKLFARLEIFPLIVVMPFLTFLLLWIKKQIDLVFNKKLNFKNYALQVLDVGPAISKTVESRYANFLAIYAVASMLAYSYVPYKTPWLIINMTVPAVVSSSIYIKINIRSKIVWALLMFFFLLNSIHNSLRYNFLPESLGKFNNLIKSYGVVGELNPLAYVHTQPGMIEVANQIRKFVYQNQNARILVGVKAYWPMPYYLREFESQLMYLPDASEEKLFNEYDIIIANNTYDVDRDGWNKTYYRLSDNQECNLYIRAR